MRSEKASPRTDYIIVNLIRLACRPNPQSMSPGGRRNIWPDQSAFFHHSRWRKFRAADGGSAFDSISSDRLSDAVGTPKPPCRAEDPPTPVARLPSLLPPWGRFPSECAHYSRLLPNAHTKGGMSQTPSLPDSDLRLGRKSIPKPDQRYFRTQRIAARS